jgi:hypothetical protein
VHPYPLPLSPPNYVAGSLLMGVRDKIVISRESLQNEIVSSRTHGLNAAGLMAILPG